MITNNLQYQGGENGTDALGLIASNSVKIYHPVRQTCTETDSSGPLHQVQLHQPHRTRARC